MTIDDTLGGFVLDASALAALGGGENIYATTWADRAAMRGIALLVPAGALSEAWQQICRHGPDHLQQMRDPLASPMVLIEPLEESHSAQDGELVEGRDLTPDGSRSAGRDLRASPGLARGCRSRSCRAKSSSPWRSW